MHTTAVVGVVAAFLGGGFTLWKPYRFGATDFAVESEAESGVSVIPDWVCEPCPTPAPAPAPCPEVVESEVCATDPVRTAGALVVAAAGGAVITDRLHRHGRANAENVEAGAALADPIPW